MIAPVVQFAWSYGAGLWVGLVFLVPAGVAPVVLLIAGACAWRRRTWWAALLAAVALGLGQGRSARLAQNNACANRWGRGRHTAILTLDDAPDSAGRTSATVRFAPERCGGSLMVRLPGPMPAGATIIAVGTMGGARLSVRHARDLHRRRPWRPRLRALIARRIHRLYGRRAPLVDALVLGDRRGIASSVRDTFVDAGLAHLLAISGLHVGILALWLALALRPLGRRRAEAVALVVVWCYVGLLAWPAPAVRAATFLSFLAVARRRQRHPGFGSMLAAAALVLVAVNPETVSAVGAWLSGAAVWGANGGARLMPRRLRGVGASIGATLTTAPIAAWVFGTVAPIGIAANLVAIPLLGLAVPGVFASLVAGVFAGGAGLVLAGIERVARAAAAVPGGHITGAPGFMTAFPWLALLAAVLWIRRNRPAPRVWRFRILAAVTAGVWIWAVLGFRAADRGGIALYVLDVGQGDAILIRTPHGHWISVDGGPRGPMGDAARRVVIPFLQRHGADRLDLTVATHGDADHLGGVPELVSTFDPRLVLEPGQPLGTPLYAEFLATVRAYAVPWRAARLGDTLVIDSVRLAVLHPTARGVARDLRPNENSVVLRVSYRAFDAVLTGDAGLPAESTTVRFVRRSEVLKVGHHGSSGATGDRWLDAVHPKVAVISVGAHNRYGHPAAATLARLRRHGAAIYRTDHGGTVTIRSDGHYLEVSQGPPFTFATRLRCLVRSWLPSKASSSSRSGCIRRRAASSPTSYTMWPSPPN